MCFKCRLRFSLRFFLTKIKILSFDLSEKIKQNRVLRHKVFIGQCQ